MRKYISPRLLPAPLQLTAARTHGAGLFLLYVFYMAGAMALYIPYIPERLSGPAAGPAPAGFIYEEVLYAEAAPGKTGPDDATAAFRPAKPAQPLSAPEQRNPATSGAGDASIPSGGDEPVHAEAGFDYNFFAYRLLREIIGKVTGILFEDYVAPELLPPLAGGSLETETAGAVSATGGNSSSLGGNRGQS